MSGLARASNIHSKQPGRLLGPPLAASISLRGEKEIVSGFRRGRRSQSSRSFLQSIKIAISRHRNGISEESLNLIDLAPKSITEAQNHAAIVGFQGEWTY